MFCVKAPRSLRTKENNFDSPVNCWGKISRLRKIDCEKYGLQEGVCLCVRHLQGEKQKIGSLYCSEEDQCSGRLTSCPKRLFPVFESVDSVIGSGSEKHLRTVPTIVTAHTFCASRDTRVSYGILKQEYFCAV